MLVKLLAEQPDAYCWELADRLQQRTGVVVDRDTVGRALTRLCDGPAYETLSARQN